MGQKHDFKRQGKNLIVFSLLAILNLLFLSHLLWPGRWLKLPLIVLFFLVLEECLFGHCQTSCRSYGKIEKLGEVRQSVNEYCL